MCDLDQEIGKRLRKARKLAGYKSARVFAIKQNIPESTYSQHETGKRSLSPSTLLRYCTYLDIEPGWLLVGSGVSDVLPSKEAAVPEAHLNASYRQAGPQSGDVISIDKTVFAGVLSKAILRFFDAEARNVNINALLEYCFNIYSRVVAMAPEQPNQGGLVREI